MQHSVSQRKALQACIIAALVTLASAASAATDQPADARTADARSLFRAEFGISSSQQAVPASQADGSAKLEGQRGGTDTHTTNNTANLQGGVNGNSAVNVMTGANTIDAGSFANMSGIPVVIQNSGANVLIQNATIINLQMK
jgi:hypothetical protein